MFYTIEEEKSFMKIKILIFLVALFVSLNVSANHTVRDSILSDFDTLVGVIEDTHPDPYTNYGGRVFFHERANEIRDMLRNSEKPSVKELYELSAGFISGLQDGHSYLESPVSLYGENTPDSLVLVKFGYVDNNLVVNAIDERARHLLGSRLTGISCLPVQTVLERIATFQPCENEAGRYGFLTDYFRPLSTYRKITGTDRGKVSLELITPQGDSITYCPEIIPFEKFESIGKARSPRSNEFPSGQLEWRNVEGNMVLCLNSILARENFEFQYKNGWDYYSQLSYYYRSVGKEMPSDTVEAIYSVPEFSEVFADMLSEMKEKNIRNLIIDLRGNGGGWTPIVIPGLYMMFGDDFINTDIEGKFYRRLSDLYLRKINSTIDKFNMMNNTAYKTGDYIMPYKAVVAGTVEQRRNDFIGQAFCSPKMKELLKTLEGKPLYRPDNIYVVTDGGTFSAAFHFAFYLDRMGATIVGEASSQSPNCFMEVTPFSLPYSGLVGSVSNSLQAFLPSSDPRAKQFTPEVRITYEDYCRYGFDQNAIMKYLIEFLKSKEME